MFISYEFIASAKKSFRINISIYLNLETFSFEPFGTI